MKLSLVAFCLTWTLAMQAQTTDVFTRLKPSGPLAVGRRTMEWIDSSRREFNNSSQFRTLPVWVWYPCQAAKTSETYSILPGSWAAEQTKFFTKKLGSTASLFLQNLKAWSVPGAPVATVNEKWPVLIFGPGLTWTPAEYSTLIEDIVSYGYIVVAYVPTGFAGVTQLANGKMVYGTLGVQQQDILFKDALFVKHSLKNLENGWLEQHIDSNAVGVFGHSLGGEAALVSAAEDSSIKAVVNLDGDLMESALKVKVLQPSLFICHDERTAIATASNKMEKEGRERSEYRRHADWVRATDDAKVSLRLRISGIYHFNFTDLGLIDPSKLKENEKKNKIGDNNGDASLKLIATITREFFDRFLKHGSFYTMVSLEQNYPQVQALLWKGLPSY